MSLIFCNKPYILLDWNAVSYLKTQSKPVYAECLSIINRLKNKYAFPVCETHLLDLSSNFFEDKRHYVESDLNFLHCLSGNYSLTSTKDIIKLFRDNVSLMERFNDVIKNKDARIVSIDPLDVPMGISKIDMRIIDEKHPLRYMLEKTDGVIGSGILSNFLNKLYEPFFADKDVYKNFRDYLKSAYETIGLFGVANQQYNHNNNNYERLCKNMMPLFESFGEQSEDVLKTKWQDLTTGFLKISNNQNDFGHLITCGYMLLDLHPLFNEKLKKNKNTLSNIARDSKNVFYGSSARYLVSEDKVFLRKVNFIYDAFGVKAKALNIEDFNYRFL